MSAWACATVTPGASRAKTRRLLLLRLEVRLTRGYGTHSSAPTSVPTAQNGPKAKDGGILMLISWNRR